MATSTAPLIVLKQLAGNAPAQLYPLQEALLPHVPTLTLFWLSVWCLTACVVCAHAVREYLARGKR